MKKTLIAVLTALACVVSAQETSPNLVYTTQNPPPAGAQFSWSGFEITQSGGGGLWGGHLPAYNPSLGQFMFGYMPATISYSLAINSVLSGTGIKVGGIQFGLQYWNQDFSRGSLSATVSLLGASGNTLQSYYYDLPKTTQGWTSVEQTKTFDSSYSLMSLRNVNVAFTGSDDRFWAGYYGPQFRNPYVRLTYTADPLPPPPPPAIPVIPNTTTTTVQVTPTETLTIETVSVIPTSITEVQQTTTTLISAPVTTNSPTALAASPAPTATRSAGGNNAAVSMVLRNNAAQQAALQSSNLTTSIQQSQASSQDTADSGSSTGSDAVSLGMSSFNTAARQQFESMSTMDAANPTSTRNLLNMMTARPVDTEQQDREDRAARATSTASSSAQSVGADLGTGVSIGALAQIPTGYLSYSVQLITQVPFYPDRAVYANQRTVDNQRALRQLTNDSRHRDMVEQQYRR